MAFFTFKDLPQEYVTPMYSRAHGGLIQGESLEVGWLSFGAGQGAVEHAHPQEQVMIVISGKLHVRFGDQEADLEPGQAFLAPPNVPHQVTAIDDTGVISCKNLVGGVGHKI